MPEKTLVFGQEYKSGHLFNMTKTPDRMEPWAVTLTDFYRCGWKLRRKVTYLGPDIFVAGFTRHIKSPKHYKYVYHLEYQGQKKCLRVKNNIFLPNMAVCDGKGCFFHETVFKG